MLVIHPKDSTTQVLHTLYAGKEAQVYSDNLSSHAVSALLHHTPHSERILLLGHGSDKGLFYREDDTKDVFDRLVVYHPHAWHLRNRGGNLVCIWCHADRFGREEGLHGLFSGMIISEPAEALVYQVDTTPQEIATEMEKWCARLRRLLDEEPLHRIPALMQSLDDVRSPLTRFNYGNLFCL